VCGEGYPERGADAVIKGLPIESDTLLVFHSGTQRRGGELYASGGRVLGVTGVGPTAEAARERAYAGVRDVEFAGASYRSDIGTADWG
jgi:phosphoribosylamine--glycine ligase